MKSLTLILMLMSVSEGGLAQESAPFGNPPSDLSSTATIVTKDEPGTPLVITGKVYYRDGKTPYAGLVLFFYQTDITGVYNKVDNSYMRPRLHGWLKTDSKGNYELRTIKPGGYPGRREAAHIHVTFRPDGGRAQWLDSYLFEGDPRLSASEQAQPEKLGRRSPVVRLTKDNDGVLHAVRDLIIPIGREES